MVEVPKEATTSKFSHYKNDGTLIAAYSVGLMTKFIFFYLQMNRMCPRHLFKWKNREIMLVGRVVQVALAVILGLLQVVL